MRNFILPFFVIAIVSFFVFTPSFSLALFGDDWLAFYRYRYHYGIWSDGILASITYFFSPYGMQDFWMGTLERFFGLSSAAYYIVSFIMRLIAGFAIYYVAKKITASNLAAFLGALFFTITAIGLDATNWVFNMPSYAAIFCLVLFFYFFVKAQDESNDKKLIWVSLFYYLAFVAAPIRMHLLPLLAMVIDTIWLIQKRNKETLFRVIKRQTIMVGVFILLRNSGYLLGSSDEATGRLTQGVSYVFSSLLKGDYYIVLHPFVIVGRFLIPESVWPFVVSLTPAIHFRVIFVTCFSIFLPVLLYYYQIIANKKLALVAFLTLVVWGFVVKYALQNSITLLHDPAFSGAALLGGYLTFFAIFFSFVNDSSKSKFILFTLVWVFTSFAYPYIWTPQSTFGTHHRYFITSAAGLSMLFAALASYAKVWQQKVLISSIAFLFIAVHISVTHSFFQKLVPIRGQEITKNVWGSMPNIEPIVKEKSPAVFYFEGDSAILYHVITFGFPPHIAVLYNIEDGGKLPIATTDWDEVVTMTETGGKLPAYGFKQETLPIENIYAFQLKGDGTLEDITSTIISKNNNQ